jgi:hypothetical protein
VLLRSVSASFDADDSGMMRFENEIEAVISSLFTDHQI